MTIFFNAKILELKPSIVHQGDVIEQEVLVELKSGEKRTFADESALIKPEMKGKWVKISVYIVMGFPQKNPYKEYAIGPNYLLKGKIIKLEIRGENNAKVLQGMLAL